MSGVTLQESSNGARTASNKNASSLRYMDKIHSSQSDSGTDTAFSPQHSLRLGLRYPGVIFQK